MRCTTCLWIWMSVCKYMWAYMYLITCVCIIIRSSTCRSKRFKAARNLETVQTPLHFLCLLKSKTIFSLSLWQFSYASISLELYICSYWAPCFVDNNSKTAKSYYKMKYLITHWRKNKLKFGIKTQHAVKFILLPSLCE